MNLSLFRAALYLLVLFFAQALAAAGDNGLLWKIEGKSYTPSYLLGTVHSDDPRITKIPPQVDKIFRQAQSFTAEINLDLATQLQLQVKSILLPPQDLRSLIGEQRYKKCARYMLDYGIFDSTLSQLKPWVVAVQLSMPKPKTGVPLDLFLYYEAKKMGKALYGLESLDEQLAVFDEMDLQQQVVFLDQALQLYPQMDGMLEKLLQYYLKRDLHAIQRYADELIKLGDQELNQKMLDKLLVERNHRMAQRMQARLKEGNAFIAVGALHLPGKEGLLNLLKQQGYHLTPIY